MEKKDKNEELEKPASHAKKKDSGEKKTVEEWATAKNMFPQWDTTPAVRRPDGKITLGTKKQKPEYVKFAAAKAYRTWAEGALVTEEEFDKAVDEAMNGRIS